MVATLTAVLLSGSAIAAQAAPPRGLPDAAGVPRTLAQSVAASAGAVAPGFPIDFVGVTWQGEHGEVLVRFRHGGTWGEWQPMGEDGVQERGRFSSALVSAGDADAYQVRVPAGAGDPRSVAINTTDGPVATAGASCDPDHGALAFAYLSRCEWGADESLRFEPDGVTETWPEEYFPVQKVTVHHTATTNDDPDPEATVRAIYRYHAVDNGWGDIGYQFLVDEAGHVYEGRHTDDDPSTMPAYRQGTTEGVAGAHVGGWNSGNLGVSMLGTLTDRRPTAGAQRGLERTLAELARISGIAPQGSATYTNPSSGQTWAGPNIAGHRDFAATECPGGIAYELLPTVRDRVAERMAGSVTEDYTAPQITSQKAVPSGTNATITWRTSEAADSQVQYWPKKSPGRVTTTPLDLRFVTDHAVSLSGVRKRTAYVYRVISTDEAGNRTVSAQGSFIAG